MDGNLFCEDWSKQLETFTEKSLQKFTSTLIRMMFPCFSDFPSTHNQLSFKRGLMQGIKNYQNSIKSWECSKNINSFNRIVSEYKRLFMDGIVQNCSWLDAVNFPRVHVHTRGGGGVVAT